MGSVCHGAHGSSAASPGNVYVLIVGTAGKAAIKGYISWHMVTLPGQHLGRPLKKYTGNAGVVACGESGSIYAYRWAGSAYSLCLHDHT